MHDILADKDQSVHAAVLDLHARLMEKLSKIETIDDYLLLRRTHNFLLNKFLCCCVILNGKKYKNLPVTLGEPQGSVLFLAFINDLPEEVDCQVALFAGDTLMYQTIKCVHDT